MSAEKRLVLDTVNEMGSALLDLVPWRARDGLDKLVADANQRYRQADETITQRVQLVHAAIQRSQQVLQPCFHSLCFFPPKGEQSNDYKMMNDMSII